MDTFLPLLGFVMLVFGVLQIILFFKMWGMTNDMKDVAKNLTILARSVCKEDYIKECGYTLKSKGITYTHRGNKIIFSDGVEGEIANVTGMFVVKTDTEELHYDEIEPACNTLHEYLTNKRVIKNGVIQVKKITAQ